MLFMTEGIDADAEKKEDVEECSSRGSIQLDIENSTLNILLSFAVLWDTL